MRKANPWRTPRNRSSTPFIAPQALVVLFLALHDWLPLPPLNDVRAVQAADSRGKLIMVTLISTIPYAVALWGSLTPYRPRLSGMARMVALDRLWRASIRRFRRMVAAVSARFRTRTRRTP
jgi:hypothetical protein